MPELQLLTSSVDTTGDGEVRVGGLVLPRDMAVAFAVRLLDAAHVAARELPPGVAHEVEAARHALDYLDRLFARCIEVQCRMDGEGQRRLPGIRLDDRRGMVRVGALVTATLIRHKPDRSWSGFVVVWGWSSLTGPGATIDPGYRRVRANHRQIGVAPRPRLLEAR